MGISQGNLNYHFKKRDDIIETLYFQLVSQIDETMLKKQSKTVGLYALLGLSSAIMESFYDYQFSLLDFVQVMRENKIIKKHYLQLTQIRQEQFLNLFKLLVLIALENRSI